MQATGSLNRKKGEASTSPREEGYSRVDGCT